MVKELFESLLDELSKAMKIRDLHPDRNHTCKIKLANGLEIQIEMDSMAREVIIGCDLGQVNEGRYRENLFREALKANGMPAPRHGILAYSNKTEHMVLFDPLPVKDLTGDKIADAIGPFTEKALMWKGAIERGEIPSVFTGRSSGGIFGLHP